MFHVKICGITSVDDAQVAIRAGADALGLNFYRKSARAIDVQMARQIGNRVPHGVTKIGVFVNADPVEVSHTFYEAGLDAVQLHGDEPPEYLLRLGDLPIIRAFRLGEGRLDDVDAYLQQCSRLGVPSRMILVDAFSADAYGGTGKTVDWPRLAADCQQRQLPPLVLAGGLTPENVADAIRLVHPAAVDVASGVEQRPGRKDPDRVRQFVAAARAAFDSIAPI